MRGPRRGSGSSEAALHHLRPHGGASPVRPLPQELRPAGSEGRDGLGAHRLVREEGAEI